MLDPTLIVALAPLIEVCAVALLAFIAILFTLDIIEDTRETALPHLLSATERPMATDSPTGSVERASHTPQAAPNVTPRAA